MDKNTLQAMWLQACKDGTLLTPRHDPTGLAVPWNSYRTVLTSELAQNLEGFINSGEFKATYYHNNNEPATPDYYAIELTTPNYSITASGVPKLARTPDAPKDRLIFVSGQNQGWHCFGENDLRIQQNITAGILIFKEFIP
jgi:hypothetical protein